MDFRETITRAGRKAGVAATSVLLLSGAGLVQFLGVAVGDRWGLGPKPALVIVNAVLIVLLTALGLMSRRLARQQPAVAPASARAAQPTATGPTVPPPLTVTPTAPAVAPARLAKLLIVRRPVAQPAAQPVPLRRAA